MPLRMTVYEPSVGLEEGSFNEWNERFISLSEKAKIMGQAKTLPWLDQENTLLFVGHERELYGVRYVSAWRRRRIGMR